MTCGLKKNIPVKLDKRIVQTEFEGFYQHLLRNLSHIPENDISVIKTKLQSTYEKYSNVYVPYEYRKVVEKLSKYDNIVILKNDLQRRGAHFYKQKYSEKCL